MNAPASDVRDRLEHHARRHFDVDETACAAVLAAEYGPAGYIFPGRDASGLWWALRRDGLPGVTGMTPDDLRRAVLADYAAHPGRPR